LTTELAVECGVESRKVEKFDPSVEGGAVPDSDTAVLVADDEDPPECKVSKYT